jgi:hypothetical protein
VRHPKIEEQQVIVVLIEERETLDTIGRDIDRVAERLKRIAHECPNVLLVIDD